MNYKQVVESFGRQNYNRMVKIINFKELVFNSGAFFDRIAVSVRLNELNIKVCQFKSGQFKTTKNSSQYSKAISVRLKLPQQCTELSIVVHPIIIGMQTDQQIIGFDLKSNIARVVINAETELGSFSCLAVVEQEKYLAKINECSSESQLSFLENSSIESEQQQDSEIITENSRKINKTPKAFQKQNFYTQRTVKPPKIWAKYKKF